MGRTTNLQAVAALRGDRTGGTRMWRRLLALLMIGCTLAFLSAGCPTVPGGDTGGDTGGDVTGDGSDPLPAPTPSLGITTTDSTLSGSQSATLAAVLSNFTTVPTITWSIVSAVNPATGAPATGVLSFTGGGSTASGAVVSVVPTGNPTGTVRHTVRATTTTTNTFTAEIPIDVFPGAAGGGASTFLAVNPFATPAVGVNSSGQVVLDPATTSAVGETSVTWAPLFPTALPAGLTEADGPLPGQRTLSVPAGVSGVFPYRVTATDSAGNADTGIVNVYLGIDSLTLDAQATRLSSSPAATITLRTIRAGGSPDGNSLADGAFTYSWQVLDESNTSVPGLTFSIGGSSVGQTGVPRDANVTDWDVTGVSTTGTLRFIATVTDVVSGATASSSTPVVVAGPDQVGLAMEPTFSRVGSGVGFRLRSVRTGGSGPFAYTMQVLNSVDVDVTGSFSFAPTFPATASAATNDWTVSGTATTDDYRFFLTLTDGSGEQTIASAIVTVGDVFSIDVAAAVQHSGIANGTRPNVLRTTRRGGVGTISNTMADSNYSWIVLDRLGASVGTGTINVTTDTPGSGASLDWDVTLTGVTPGTYRFICTAIDDAGVTATSSAEMEFTDDFQINASASSIHLGLPTAATAVPNLLRTFRTGGIGTVADSNYAWLIQRHDGTFFANGALFTVASASVGASTPELFWNVTVPAVGNPSFTPGTYRFIVTANDGEANNAAGVTEILFADALDIDAQTTRVQIGVPAAGATFDQLLRTVRTGGVAAFTYTWTVRNAAGGTVAGLTPTIDAGSATTDVAINWDVTVAVGTTPGTYRFECAVRDGRNNTHVSSVEVLIANTLSLDVRSDDYAVSPAGMDIATLTYDVTGGVGPYSYDYSGFDEGGAAIAAGYFTPSTPQSGQAGDIIVTLDPSGPGALPNLANGFYTVIVTVTDAVGNSFTDSVAIEVIP
jgi:hypothetical protein